MERRSEYPSKISINISGPGSAKDSIESKDNKDNFVAPPDDFLNINRSNRSNSAKRRKDRPASKQKTRESSAREQAKPVAPPSLSNQSSK